MRHRTLQEYRGAALDVGAGERGAGLGRGCQRVGERARPERSHGKCAVGMGVQVGEAGRASHARLLLSWRSGSISAIRPSRSEMLNRPSRSGMMTEATNVSKAVAMIGRLRRAQ